MRYVRGRVFEDVLLKDCSPVERRAMYSDLATVLAKIHCIDYFD